MTDHEKAMEAQELHARLGRVISTFGLFPSQNDDIAQVRRIMECVMTRAIANQEAAA